MQRKWKNTHLDIIVQANVNIGCLGAIFISVGKNLQTTLVGASKFSVVLTKRKNVRVNIFEDEEGKQEIHHFFAKISVRTFEDP